MIGWVRHVKYIGERSSSPDVLPINIAPPVITGTLLVGSTLTATPGVWSGADSVAGEWYVDGVATSETGLTYEVQLADAGLLIEYRETASNTFGSSTASASVAAASLAANVEALYANGEEGAWYDPSDFATLFQDSAGTTPVTAVEQSVGLILDKRLPTTSTVPLDAMAFLPDGSTPPTTTDTTFLSEACGSVTFPANAGGYSVSRAASGTPHSIVIGRRYSHSYRIALSRALTGGESLVVFTTGDVGSANNITLNSSTASGAWIDFADATVASATVTGYNTCYVFAGTAITSPITVYIRQYTVRELPGNHASQITAASRPKLSARKNLLLTTEDFSDPNWIRTNLTPAQVSGAEWTLTPTVTSGQHQCTNNVGTINGPAAMTIEVKPNGYTKVAWKESITSGAHSAFNLSGAGSVIDSTAAGATITLLPDGFYRVTMVVGTTGSLGRTFIVCASGYAGGDPNGSTFVGDGTSGVIVRYPQVESGSIATAYQRVTTATDYDTEGFPHFISFDGVDDKLTTTFPDLGSNVTIARSVPGEGASILTGQTIGAGAWDDSTNQCGLVIVNRALTGPETDALTAFLNAKAGV